MSEKQAWQKGNNDNVESKKVIQVKDLTKMYKLYDKPSDRLKEALGLTRKKLYKEHYALHDVTFDINEGECVGIIGTNGSGKSTILKIITGVLTRSQINRTSKIGTATNAATILVSTCIASAVTRIFSASS